MKDLGLTTGLNSPKMFSNGIKYFQKYLKSVCYK